MLSGMTDLHRELERRVAQFLQREDAMIFNSVDSAAPLARFPDCFVRLT